MKRWNDKKLGLLALAAVMFAGGAGLVLWVLTPNRGPGQTADSSASARPSIAVSYAAFAQPKAYPCPIPGDFKSADIPVGLLCDYYEHGIEHAPPRDPSGVMQKRERFYAAPHDPVEIIESGGEQSSADEALVAELKTASGRWPNASLEKHVWDCSLKSDALIDAGRALDWLRGDNIAAAFFAAGLIKARNEYAAVPPGDPAAFPLLHAMDQTKALWRIKAWPALEKRFRLANALRPAYSAEQRRAHYLVADMLYNECQYTDAATEIARVAAEDEREHDLGLLDRSDVAEMEWTQALFLMADRQIDCAIVLFDCCARHEGVHQLDSRRLAVLAAIRSDHLDDALERAKALPMRASNDALASTIFVELQARLRERERPLIQKAETR